MWDAVLVFLRDYGLFFAKTVTVLFAVLVVVARLGAVVRGAQHTAARLHVRRLDRRLRHLGRAIDARLLGKKAWKALVKADEAAEAAIAKLRDAGERKRLYVLDFVGDIRASQVESLRQEITAILGAHRNGDRVLVRLESPGGVVHGYGLAASQLQRLRDAGVELVVAVDKVAASGGYLMAAVASRIVAAPFALVGSIGVVAQLPNLHKLLKKHDVDVELLTAGKFKRTLTVFGENTDEGRAQFQRDLDQTHQLFQAVIARHRPAVALDEVADGRVWYGTQAKDLGLVDAIGTSDDLLVQAATDHDVVELRWRGKPALGARLQTWTAATLGAALGRVLDLMWARQVQGPR
ncbi:MAG: protease SohB [Deltaproteobacteria bacterium]|nr:protease SohB [Deltaproteobacteria bacterium]